MGHEHRRGADPMSPGRVPTEREIVFNTSGSAPDNSQQKHAGFSTSACNRRVQTPETGGETERGTLSSPIGRKKRGTSRRSGSAYKSRHPKNGWFFIRTEIEAAARSRLQKQKISVLHQRGAFSERDGDDADERRRHDPCAR